MRLTSLGRVMQRAVTQALQRWARETSNSLRAAAPVATRQLCRSIRVEPEPNGAMIIAPVVQATTTDRGARPHPINPRRKKALHWSTPRGAVTIGPRVAGGWLATRGGRSGRGLRQTTWLKRTVHAVWHPGNAGTGWWTRTVRSALREIDALIAAALRQVAR